MAFRAPLRSLAALAAVLSTPALAQQAPGAAASLTWSKSEAILGAPSALEAILAKQNGAPLSARPAIEQASIARPQMMPPMVSVRPVVSGAARSGRPDVFGSVALRVGRTPLDKKWLAVGRSPVGPAAARFAEAQRGKEAFERLEAVNWYVNKRVRFTDDSRQFGRADVWLAAADTLRRGRGDCEDYAIAKLQMLRRAGFADHDLYLVVVKDLVRRADHAVLVARADGRMYVLDNGTDQVLDSEQVSDYRPMLSFSAAGAWTHGYRLQSAPVGIASAEPVKPVVPAANPQRSRSASPLAFNTGFSK